MARSTESHYDLLGVSPGASQPEIRKAYVALARRFHPDGHAGRSPAERAHAERRMQAVNSAWAVLSDPGRRRTYDAELNRVERSKRAEPRKPPPGPGWRPRADDDAWLDDFGRWKVETDLLPPDVPGEARPMRLVPPALAVLAGAVALFALITDTRPVMAFAFMLMGLSIALWVWLTISEMARSRHDDD